MDKRVARAADVYGKHDIREAPFYKRMSNFGALEVPGAKRLRTL